MGPVLVQAGLRVACHGLPPPQTHLRHPAELSATCINSNSNPSLFAQIYDTETVYFTAEYTNFGTVLKVGAQHDMLGVLLMMGSQPYIKGYSFLGGSYECLPCHAQGPPSTQCKGVQPRHIRNAQGFEGFLTSKNAAAKNKNRVFRLEDRAISLSSTTSPAVCSFFHVQWI